MALLGDFYTIEPSKWLFRSHGDVIHGEKRANEYFNQHGTYAGAEDSIEEFVRQWALRELINSYSYPESWLGSRIIIEEEVTMGSSKKQCDISIKNDSGRTFLFIEAKNSGVSNEEFEGARKQLESYLSATHTATIGMVTDGKRIKSVQKKVDPNDFIFIPDIPAFNTKVSSQSKLLREIPALGPKDVTGLRLITSNIKNILGQCHDTIRNIEGMHADEALDELCKMIYAKIYDENLTVSKSEGAEFKFQTYGAANASEVAANIRSMYEEAKEKDIKKYSPHITDYERSRGVFKQQIRLSDGAIYAIVEKLQNYSLVDSSVDIKGKAFQHVISSAIRSGMGQYFTPDEIVDLAVRIIDPSIDHTIIDPFCGSGHFLTKALEYVEAKYKSTVRQRELYQFRFFHLHGIEKSDRMVRIAMTDMFLHDDGHTNIRNMDALLSQDNYPDIQEQLERIGIDKFDLVMTNPPFGSNLKKEDSSQIDNFSTMKGKKNIPLEIVGLERSFQFLKPGGRIAVVLPDGILKNKNAKQVRSWIENIADIEAVISLPEDAFNSFGAMIKTSLCIMRKHDVDEISDPKAETLLIELGNIGYDATGRFKSGSEIDEAVQAYKDFMRSRGSKLRTTGGVNP